jgi:hypothetical protein
VTTMGVVTGAVSALVAAFFGVRAGTYAEAKDVEREKHRDQRQLPPSRRPGSGVGARTAP